MGRKAGWLAQATAFARVNPNGDMVEGQARAPKDNERYFGLLKVEKVNETEAYYKKEC